MDTNKTKAEEQKNQQVAEYWSWVASRGELGFWNVPGWNEHQNLLASKSADTSWLDVLSEEILADEDYTPGIALSLGCGSGSQERALFEKGLATEIEGCDISSDLIDRAQKEADKQRLPFRYFVNDLNHPNFPEGKYSLIYAAGILHHVENLEGLFQAVKKALTPNGVFLIYDYVGPTRFQWTEEQIKAGNALIKVMPLKFRLKRGYPWYYYVARSLFSMVPFLKMKSVETVLKKTLPPRVFAQFLRVKRARIFLNGVVPPPIEQFAVTDPSEAVRSAEILPQLKKHFRFNKVIEQGGTLAQPLFNRTAATFMTSKEGKEVAEKVFQQERKMIENEEIPSDFVALLLSKDLVG